MKRSELPSHPEGLPENGEARQLGELLRKYAPAPRECPPGLNAAVLRRIEAETPAEETPRPAAAALRRVVWSGLGGLAAAAALFLAWVQPALRQNGPPPEYYARILNGSDPAISAVALHPPQEGVTVLWIDGLDYVPAQKVKN